MDKFKIRVYVNTNHVINTIHAVVDLKTCVKETSELRIPFHVIRVYWNHSSPGSETGTRMGLMTKEVTNQSAESH